jgi:anaerobic dimethyl sulfoxide reductase subunit A
MITPHPRWRTHSIFHNIPWLRETYQQEVTLNAAMRGARHPKTGDIVEVWNARGKVVVPAYVTERCMPGVVVCTRAPGWTSTRRASIAPATRIS